VTPELLHVSVGSADAWCSGAQFGSMTDPVNQTVLARAADLPDPDAWAWVKQVHGRRLVDADAALAATEEADAIVTTAIGLPVAIVTADCAPVVVANNSAVAVAHAGHRGLVAGVIEEAVDAVRVRGSGAVHAFLGPCIRAECYEFGADALEAISARYGNAVVSTTSKGTPALDIPAAVRVALARAGVQHFVDSGQCTAHTAGYFSYRRDQTSDRQVTVAVLR
jgi:YfiH family protein